MITLYFIRHAESEANALRVLASRLPYPLTEKGHKDAEAAALDFTRSILGDRNLETIISSSLLRARQTAEPFSRILGIPVESEELLVEQGLGKYTGMSYDEVELEKNYMHDRTLRWDWEPEGGGESYRQLSLRVTAFLRKIERRFADGMQSSVTDTRILCVTHAVTMRLIWAVLHNMLPEYPIWLARNGEVWEVQFTGLGNLHTIERHFPKGVSEVWHSA